MKLKNTSSTLTDGASSEADGPSALREVTTDLFTIIIVIVVVFLALGLDLC